LAKHEARDSLVFSAAPSKVFLDHASLQNLLLWALPMQALVEGLPAAVEQHVLMLYGS
jgi:hypothetical protein